MPSGGNFASINEYYKGMYHYKIMLYYKLISIANIQQHKNLHSHKTKQAGNQICKLYTAHTTQSSTFIFPQVLEDHGTKCLSLLNAIAT